MQSTGTFAAYVDGPDPSWTPLYRAGALSAGLAVVMYIAALVLFIAATEPPTSGGAAMLEYIDAHRTTYIVRQLLWLMPSLPMIVVVLALTVAFQYVSKSFATIAGVIAAASWAVSFGYPTTGEGALAMVKLSDQYAIATGTERSSFVAGAEVLMALNDIPGVIGVLQTLGILLISLLMLKGDLLRGSAWLAVVTGVVGIAAEALRPLLGWAYAIYGLLLFVWLIWIARALWTLGAPSEVTTERGAGATS